MQNFLFLLLFLCTFTSLQAAELKASVEAHGDLFRFELTLSDAATIPASTQIRLPALEGLQVQSGPSISTSTRIVNGVSSRSCAWTWILRPTTQNPGPIPSFTLKYKGQPLRTKSLPLKAKALAKAATRHLALLARPSKLDPFVGEEVLVEFFLLYSGVKLVGLDPPVLERVPGFLVDFEEVQEYKSQNILHQGRNQEAILLGTATLLPTRIGELVLPPQEATVQLEAKQNRRRQNMGSFFGGSMFAQRETLPQLSSALHFDVQALPKGAPESFTGAVGQYSVSASPDRKTLREGESLTLTVTVNGFGKTALLRAPLLRLSEGLVAYETQVDERKTSRGVRKRFKTMIVPARAGLEDIKSLSFSWFNTKTKSYEERVLGPWKLEILPARLKENTGQGSASMRDVKSYGEDIRHLRYLNHALPVKAATKKSWLLALSLLSALAFAITGRLLSGYMQIRQGSSANRRAQALSQAARELKRMQKLPTDEALAATESLLREYFAAVFDRPAAGLLLQELPLDMRSEGIDQAICEGFEHFQKEMDSMRYGGSTLRQEIYEDCMPLLRRIDAALGEKEA
jgi:hypothetical protein